MFSMLCGFFAYAMPFITLFTEQCHRDFRETNSDPHENLEYNL